MAGHDAQPLQRLSSELQESSHRTQVELHHLLAADDLAHQLKGGGDWGGLTCC